MYQLIRKIDGIKFQVFRFQYYQVLNFPNDNPEYEAVPLEENKPLPRGLLKPNRQKPDWWKGRSQPVKKNSKI